MRIQASTTCTQNMSGGRIRSGKRDLESDRSGIRPTAEGRDWFQRTDESQPFYFENTVGQTSNLSDRQTSPDQEQERKYLTLSKGSQRIRTHIPHIRHEQAQIHECRHFPPDNMGQPQSSPRPPSCNATRPATRRWQSAMRWFSRKFALELPKKHHL